MKKVTKNIVCVFLTCTAYLKKKEFSLNINLCLTQHANFSGISFVVKAVKKKKFQYHHLLVRLKTTVQLVSYCCMFSDSFNILCINKTVFTFSLNKKLTAHNTAYLFCE